MATDKDENKLNEIGTGRLLMFIDGYKLDSCGEYRQIKFYANFSGQMVT